MWIYVVGTALLILLLAAIWLVGGAARRHLFERRVEKARQRFERQREELEEQFIAAASSSGKPRGLAWRQCDFHDQQQFAVDRASGEIYALVGTTISFEAIAGGGMEEVEAVGNLRYATAVFVQRGGRWTTDGRAVFNLEPHETLDRYRDSLAPVTA